MLGIITRTVPDTLLRLLEHLSIPFEITSGKVPADRMARYNALVVIADDYPRLIPDIIEVGEAIASFQASNKPVFCEFFPVKDIFTSEIVTTEYTRLITRRSDSPVLDGIDALSLFETHQNPFLVAEHGLPSSAIELLSLGRVAGVYKAIYGLPSTMHLGLVQHGTLLASSIKISDFDTMEYRLKARFCQLVMNICKFLCNGWHDLNLARFPNPFDNRSYMAPMKQTGGPARRTVYMQALVRGLDWFERAGMFPKPLGIGGVYEGFTSGFGPEGKKSYRFYDELGFKIQRADCTADTALPFLLASLLPDSEALSREKKEKYEQISNNVFHELYHYWQHYPGQSILRGFFGWANTPYDVTVAYSDDNGRVVMESLLNAHVRRDRDLFLRSFAGVNALRSTVGKNGHRWARIDLKHFYEKGGRKWFSTHAARRHQYHSPHYDAWTFAALLYGALLIGEQPVIDLIGKGIDDYMKKFPDLHLEHSAGDDFSKLLIATVMLYQATKRPDHLKHAERIIEFFAPYQDEYSGAFPEIDPYGKHARTEPRNEKYGTGESALYTDSGDTISDQLYSLGFLAIGLFLATRTGKIPRAGVMLTRLLDYLCMIQLRSGNPQLDGTWTRGFDFRLGEPYGANGDVGWGAYSIETGWTVGPILTSLALYLLDYDPFAILDPAFKAVIRDDYHEEKSIQERLEKNWRHHTPRPVKHYTSMDAEEIRESLKGFKLNSLDSV